MAGRGYYSSVSTTGNQLDAIVSKAIHNSVCLRCCHQDNSHSRKASLCVLGRIQHCKNNNTLFSQATRRTDFVRAHFSSIEEKPNSGRGRSSFAVFFESGNDFSNGVRCVDSARRVILLGPVANAELDFDILTCII